MAKAAYDLAPDLIKAYELLSIFLVIYLCFRSDNRWLRLAFGVASIALLFISRWPQIQLNVLMNPDESEMISAAKKFAIDFMPWRSVNTSSSGPLNAMSLMWPYLLGGDVTYATARLTAACCMAGTWLFVNLSLSRSVPAFRVIVCALLMLFLAGTNWFDYVDFSSEQLPTLLLAAASWCTVEQIHGDRRRFRLFLGGLVIGAVPFAKLQAAPIAATIFLFQLLPLVLDHADWKRKGQQGALLFTGLFTPLILIMGPVVLVGELHDFWISYIQWGLAYPKRAISVSTMLNLAWSDHPLAWYLIGTATLVVHAFLLKAVTALRVRRWPYSLNESLSLIFVLAALCASIYAVVKPGVPATHYLLLPVPFLALLAGSLWPRCLATTFRAPSTALLSVVFAFGLVFGVNGLRPNPSHPGSFYCLECMPNYAIMQPESLFNAGDLYSWLPKTEGRVEVWGWSPELYVFSGIGPATRDTNTYGQIVPGKFQSYFRERFLKDFDKAPPSIVVDAPAPGSFGFNTPELGLFRQFPEFAKQVTDNYTRVSSSSEDCPRTYVRNDIYAQLPFVTFKRITASAYYSVTGKTLLPAFVDDFKTSETCSDYWLLPDGQLGDINLDFEKEESVSTIRILNTRNNQGDRRTSAVRVELYFRGTVVATEELNLHRYPYWTVIPVSDTRADTLRVTILGFVGKGGGLNEIKVERSH